MYLIFAASIAPAKHVSVDARYQNLASAFLSDTRDTICRLCPAAAAAAFAAHAASRDSDAFLHACS